MYRVFLVDDRPLPRGALRALLSASSLVAIAGEARTLAEVEDCLNGAMPSAIVADYAAVLGDAPPGPRLPPRLVLINVPPLARAAGFEAAAGWLDRGASLDDLLAAIAVVDGGQRHVAPALRAAPGRGEAALSRREFEVMCGLAAGQTNREIAAELGISVKTIDTHRGHVLKKLNLRNNSDITRFAIRNGYLRV
jgi:DNA-binding NarL/FixJ family response regulator